VPVVKWRTGCEGRISTVKRDWGWARLVMDGQVGTHTWCGWGVLSHNSVKVARLVDTKHASPVAGPLAEPSWAAGTSPPTDPLSAGKAA